MQVEMKKNKDDQYWQLYWLSGEPVKCKCGRQAQVQLHETPTKGNHSSCGKVRVSV
jgi:hypothetical protein